MCRGSTLLAHATRQIKLEALPCEKPRTSPWRRASQQCSCFRFLFSFFRSVAPYCFWGSGCGTGKQIIIMIIRSMQSWRCAS
jgi:hypothetical protein